MIPMTRFLISLASLVASVGAFSVRSLPNGRVSSRLPAPPQFQHQMLPDSSSFLTALDVFDGSNIDPVVVSSVFWTGLKSKILAVIIGQVLAAVAFAILSSFMASQISQLGDFATKTFFSGDMETNSNQAKPFIRADELSSAKPTPDFGKLLICLTIDVLGSANELIPILGEVTDIIYAPIAATVLRNLYGSNILFALEFTEEILPFTDILPLATLCWVVDTFFGASDLAKVLQLGKYSSAGWAEDAIDTKAESTRLPPGKNDRER